MNGVRNWAVGSVIAALVLLSPTVAFLMVIAAELLIDLRMEVGITAACALATGAIGLVLYRKRSARVDGAPQWKPEEEPDEGVIAAPPG